MRIGAVGPSYQEASLPFDAQRSVNCYPVTDQYQDDKQRLKAMYSAPGLANFGEAGTGPGRGRYTASNGRSFAVSGSGLYEVFSDGTTTLRGSLDQTHGNVTFAENTIQLAVCDGASLYLMDYADDSYRKMSHGDITFQIAWVTYHDGYFIIGEGGSGRFYISGINDGEVWDALDFATAESDPDGLVRGVSALGYLWLFGKVTTEIWSNVGASDFPFRRMSGAVLEKGAAGAHTIVEVDNSLIWLGRDKGGTGIVYQASGFTPVRISTSPIEKRLRAVADDGLSKAYAYQEDGRWFYVLNDDALETSWAFDLEVKAWHERAYLGTAGDFQPQLLRDVAFAFGKHIGVDRRNGTLYDVSNAYYDNAGEPLCRDRITTHVAGELGQRATIHRLMVTVETGVGLQGSGVGSDPKLLLRVSKDMGRTWGAWREGEVGRAGEYRKTVAFRQLGNASTFTFEFRMTDPVPFTLIDAQIEV